MNFHVRRNEDDENKQLSSIINVNFNEKYKKITEEIINEDFREPVQKKLIPN